MPLHRSDNDLLVESAAEETFPSDSCQSSLRTVPPHLLLSAAGLALTATIVSAAAPSSALAGSFKPRRSHRRLPGWEHYHPEIHMQNARGAVKSTKEKAARMKKALAREDPALVINLPIPSNVSIPGAEHVTAAAAAVQKGVQSAHKQVKRAMGEQAISVSARDVAPFTPSYARTGDAQTAYILGAGVLGLLGFFVWQAMAGGRRRKAGGRYVRDRSLGGKEIWIPYDEPGRPSSPTSASRGPRAIFTEEDLSIDSAPSSSSSSSSANGMSSATDTRRGPSNGAAAVATHSASSLPSWWTEPRTRYVMDSQREDLRSRAQLYLRSMEELKFSGQDYSMDKIREIVQLGLEGNVTVKCRTESGRDAVFRFAMDHVIEATFTGRTLMLGGLRAREFIPALAQTLQMPTQKAVEIATGAVAAKTRGLLLSALAHVRGKDDLMAYTDLSFLGMLWREVPLEPGSAQVDMLSRSLSSVMGAREARELLRMFEQAVGAEPALKELMKETLMLFQ